MPKRLTVQQHATLYRFIADRDGEQCLICKKTPLPGKPLHIDHADNNPDNWDPENVHLLCEDDNLDLRGFTTEEHLELVSLCCAFIERERFFRHGLPATGKVKDVVDYRSGSPEMQANSYFEIQYRDWMLVTVKEEGFITKDDAIDGAAEMFGCSQQSCERYLRKLISTKGPLTKSKDTAGTIIIIFKRGH